MIGQTDTFLIGNAGKRGYNDDTIAEINRGTRTDYGYRFYSGAISPETVATQLFDWEAVAGSFIAEAPTASGPIFSGDHDFKAIMHSRTGHIFGVHKDGYKIHQYQDWLLTEVSTLLDQDLAIGSAATLDKGGRAFVTVEMPDNIVGPGGIEFRPYLLAATSHDGSIATTYKWATILPVCRNTFAAALGEALASIKVRHTRHSIMQLQNSRDALGIVFKGAEAFEEGLAKLLDSKVTDADWTRVLDATLPISGEDGRGKTIAINKRSILNDLWRNDERVAPWTGTAFGVVQAFSTATQHEFTVRGKDREARNLGAGTMGAFDATDRATLQTLRDLDLVTA